MSEAMNDTEEGRQQKPKPIRSKALNWRKFSPGEKTFNL